MPTETEAKDKDKKKPEATLEGQLQGLTAAQAADRAARKLSEGGKRAKTEESVAAAVAKDKFTMDVETPEKKAEKWAKANNIQFGLGGAASFYRKVKEGKTPEQAARELRLIK